MVKTYFLNKYIVHVSQPNHTPTYYKAFARVLVGSRLLKAPETPPTHHTYNINIIIVCGGVVGLGVVERVREKEERERREGTYGERENKGKR